MDVLKEILENKKVEISTLPEINSSQKFPSINSFYSSISTPEKGFAIIAEIKTKSPSKGVITENKPIDIAKEYDRLKIDSISVLTDQRYFCGKIEDISDVHGVTKIPILCKDFIIDKRQIYQARLAGASAILLIVRALKSVEKIKELYDFASELAMDSLVEINNEDELKIAIEINPKIIGINSRNLSTLEINKTIFQTLLPKIPNHICKLALSGIETKNDILEIKNIANGALIGTSICSLPLYQISKKIEEFRSVL